MSTRSLPPHLVECFAAAKTQLRSLNRFAEQLKYMTTNEIHSAHVKAASLAQAIGKVVHDLRGFVDAEVQNSEERVHALSARLLSTQGTVVPELITMRTLYTTMLHVANLCGASTAVLYVATGKKSHAVIDRSSLLNIASLTFDSDKVGKEGDKALGVPDEVLDVVFKVWQYSVSANITTETGIRDRQFRSLLALPIPVVHESDSRGCGVLLLLNKRSHLAPEVEEEHYTIRPFSSEDELRAKSASEVIGETLRRMPLEVEKSVPLPLLPGNFAQEWEMWTREQPLPHPPPEKLQKWHIFRTTHGPQSLSTLKHRSRTILEPSEVMDDIMKRFLSSEQLLAEAHSKVTDQGNRAVELANQLEATRSERLKVEQQLFESKAEHELMVRELLHESRVLNVGSPYDAALGSYDGSTVPDPGTSSGMPSVQSPEAFKRHEDEEAKRIADMMIDKVASASAAITPRRPPRVYTTSPNWNGRSRPRLVKRPL